ncbi:hypothetical protein ACTWP5_30850 [Streptomyces sp. 4N509B]|uniref:hypothetical protein n=1 Tax=Streptomyces sp. 4N509B TaxID=3457413 RepID=UPI003FD69DF1
MASLKGSPGATTTALALAAGWPGDAAPVVVECDAAGGDLVARFRGLELAPGLVSLAAAARRAGEDDGLIWRHTQRLPGGLAVVPGPPGAEQARAALAELASGAHGQALRRWAGRPGVVVVADCGRLDAHAPTLAVVRQADVLVLLSGAGDDALAHLAVGLDAAARWCRRTVLVLVGQGHATEEVASALGIEVAGRIPYDPRGAAAFTGRPAGRRAPARSELGRAAAGLAARIEAELAASHGSTDVSRTGQQPLFVNVPDGVRR